MSSVLNLEGTRQLSSGLQKMRENPLKITLAVPSCTLMQPLSGGDRTRNQYKEVPKDVIFVLQGTARLTACFCLLQRQTMMVLKGQKKG